MKRLVLFFALLLLVNACGGSSEPETTDGGDEPTSTAPTQPEEDDDQSDTTSPDDDDGDDSGGEGPSTATVTIGDETYEFSSEGAIVAQCLPDLFGIMSVQLPMADGGDGGLQIVALHEDTDPEVVGEINSVQVTIGDVDWVADPEDVNIAGNPDVPAGQSEVTSIEVDGNTVRGTANFAGSETIFSADFVQFASGTFEATCGEERTS